MSLMVYLHTAFILFIILFCIKAYFLMEDLFNYLKSENLTQRDLGGRSDLPPPPPRPTNWERNKNIELIEANDYEGLQLSKYEEGDIV